MPFHCARTPRRADRRRNASLLFLPLAIGLGVSSGHSGAFGQSSGRLDPVVVTASRFGDSQLTTASNVTVLTREDIEASGAQTVPDILRLLAGVDVRPLYGSMATDTSVDLRGFGEGANLRTLVLLDGLRLNPIDTDSVDWGLVPLEAIDRIEVMSGSGSVLYGDNAVGGVINIITDPQRTGTSVQTGIGSNRSGLLAARTSRQEGNVSASLSATRQTTDGWRENNRQARSAASIRLAHALERGELFLALGASETRAGLPGYLTREQYLVNPRQPETRDSFFERAAFHVRPGIRWKIGDSLDFAMEAGLTELRKSAWFSNWFNEGYDERKTDTVSLTPRLQWRHRLADMPSRTVVGIDRYDGDLRNDKSDAVAGPVVRTVRIGQLSEALYLQNQTTLGSGVTLTLGGRHQIHDQSVRDSLGQSLAQRYERHIGDLGLSWRVAPSLRLFTRAGSSFRFPSLDELTTFKFDPDPPFASRPGFVTQPVRPERGAFADVGGQWRGHGINVMATVYRLDMVDEITYNPISQENENMAKTRRLGVDLASRLELGRNWRVQGGLATTRATFSEGVDRGNRVPLVPRQKLTAGITHLPVQTVSLSVFAVRVSDRYSGSDTANAQAPLSAYTTFDLAGHWQTGNWTWRGRIANLLDHRYAPNGWAGPWGSGFYPADGRTVFVDLRRDL
ncbi:MAG: TonB-dependent receptor [Betaproteobacteria bacterium]|nr:TonB-dependent receptor [Betaproteobacteria bacterium]